MPDRKALRELRAKLDGGGLDEGRRVLDLSATAIYQLEPTWATAIVCVGCHYVALVPKLPVRSLMWTCSQCRRSQRLDPPIEVLIAASRPPAPGARA